MDICRVILGFLRLNSKNIVSNLAVFEFFSQIAENDAFCIFRRILHFPTHFAFSVYDGHCQVSQKEKNNPSIFSEKCNSISMCSIHAKVCNLH
jgi:hypothetical protein